MIGLKHLVTSIPHFPFHSVHWQSQSHLVHYSCLDLSLHITSLESLTCSVGFCHQGLCQTPSFEEKNKTTRKQNKNKVNQSINQSIKTQLHQMCSLALFRFIYPVKNENLKWVISLGREGEGAICILLGLGNFPKQNLPMRRDKGSLP